MHPERVTDVKQSLLQETARPMRNHAISLHFAESKTTVSSSTFDRLTSKDLCRASRSRVNLVIDHVSQPLIVCWTKEYLRNKLPAGMAIVHHLEASGLVAHAAQEL